MQCVLSKSLNLLSRFNPLFKRVYEAGIIKRLIKLTRYFLNIEQIIKHFDLSPLPEEGGYFKRTYQAKDSIMLERGERKVGDGIMYLITKDQFSGLHKLLCDELWHFYAGDPVEQIIFNEEKIYERELGNKDFFKHSPQGLVPANYWQATRLKDGGEWALLGTSAFPAYDHSDFMMGDISYLTSLHPKNKERILRYV
jgi:predicted cupin superfamily sugar epimerase